MDIKTKFDIGDMLSVISGNAIKDFAVRHIIIDKNGVYYQDDNYSKYAEAYCFGSRQELLDYIIGNTEKQETESINPNT